MGECGGTTSQSHRGPRGHRRRPQWVNTIRFEANLALCTTLQKFTKSLGRTSRLAYYYQVQACRGTASVVVCNWSRLDAASWDLLWLALLNMSASYSTLSSREEISFIFLES